MTDHSQGISNVWRDHRDMQQEFLRGIIRVIRHQMHEESVEQQANYLERMGAFFVPSGEYLIERFGKSIQEPGNGIFIQNDVCTLAERLAFPMRFANGTVPAFIGYSNKPDDWPDDVFFPKYVYPGKYVLEKGRWLFIEPDEMRRAIEEQYICVVDGLFDKITLQTLGINAVSLGGSMLTSWHKHYLSFIGKIIVIADNDKAGRNLYNSCRYAFKNVVEIRQPYTGDIDNFLKTDERIEVFKECFQEMRNEGFLISKEIRNGRQWGEEATKVF